MIDVQEAVRIAKQKAVEILGAESASLEEIDRGMYNGSDAWNITLGVPRDLNQLSPLARMSVAPIQYRRFFIDVQSGELLAMKLHELALR
ncbi:MAG: hypothetical protein ABSF12_22180 [Bryobacteraceae bacterium]|jgi:hypothetical protein